MRHAIITAGTKGLGKKVVASFLEQGYSLTVHYRSDEDAVEILKSEYPQDKHRMQFVQGDMTNKDDISRIVDCAMDQFKRIDVLVNNAGPYIFERKKLIDYTNEEWYEMIEGNLSSVFHFFKKIIPIMRSQKYGRIITYGFQGANDASGWLHRSAFSAAKVGLVSLTKTIALEEAEYGITANMICPGNIVGEMKEQTILYAREKGDKETPIGRSGTGEDIARVISFLCEENSDMITGSVIEVTGGLNVINRFR